MTRTIELLLLWCGILPPFVAVLVLAVRTWIGRWPSEAFIHKLASAAFLLVLLATTALGLIAAATKTGMVMMHLDRWFQVGHYHFPLALVADHLSIPFAIFSSCLVWITAVFSKGYLHRERGYLRYYLLLCLFGGGVTLLVFAGSLDFLLFAWEIVGLTSVLLIAFFHERKEPVRHGVHALVVYRICDIGLLGAAVWLHHSVGTTSGAHHAAPGPWWGFEVPSQLADAGIVGLLLLWGSLGKGAQLPFSGWLPRAMEGPTPSSAIFYGALSVHLGPYLLLRAAPLLDALPWLGVLVALIGLATAIHGTVVGRVQTDIKCSLAYASMTQVGVIFIEIGLGLRYLALIHIVGHAALRCLQLLRSPSILQDRFNYERQLGVPLPKQGQHIERLVPRPMQLWLYRAALERGFLDAILRDHIVSRFVRAARQIDSAQEAWADYLLGKRPRSGPKEGNEAEVPS